MADVTFDIDGWPKVEALRSAVDALGGWAPDGQSGSSFNMRIDVFSVKAQVDVKRHFGRSRIRVQTWGPAGEWWLQQAAGRIQGTIESFGRRGASPTPKPVFNPGTAEDPLDLTSLRGELLESSLDRDPWDFGSIAEPPSTGTSPIDQSSIVFVEKTLAAKPVAGPWTSLGGPGSGTHSWTSEPNNWQSDNAIDIKVPMGIPIRAIADGVISTSYGYGEMAPSGRFAGSRLHLEFGNGDVAFYHHLSQLVAKEGQRVKEGEIIGYSGTGNGVPHLHFATKKSDPVKWASKGRS